MDKQEVKKRAKEMVDAMSLREKVSQMVHEARGISRLHIPAYNWWNECLHGVGRAGTATVFPQSIGLGAMFDEQFMKEIATVISDEVRGKYNEAVEKELIPGSRKKSLLPEAISGWSLSKKLQYRGLTCWSPTINIFRDPRWGRGHESYGEDPFLTSRMGVAFVQGLQGDHPKYLKTVATPKHFAVHSGPEKIRHGFNAEVSKKDLYETYLPAFKATIQEGKAWSIMSAYNGVNGEPSTASKTLLQDILRDEWGFKGFVVSDCGAVHDIQKFHKITKSLTQAAAMSVNAGCDLNCGYIYHFLKRAVSKGFVTEETLNTSLQRLFEARIRLGMFDSPEDNPYSNIGPEVIDCEKHRDLALEASRRSLVLLKNDGMLPLKSDSQGKIGVIGPNANELAVLLGNYNGTPSSYTTPLKGIEERFDGEVLFAEGCPLCKENRDGFEKALEVANQVDTVVLCLGLSPQIEGEEGDAFNADAGGDKPDLLLPGVQRELLDRIAETGKPIVVVLLAGSPLDLRDTNTHASAIVQAWYPGQDGGKAVAELLFGDFSPSGRLPMTFVEATEDLPPFEDYSLTGRTYRYAEKAPLFPFGYGLSYTEFTYNDFSIEESSAETGEYTATVSVTNSGSIAGREVVQLYYKRTDLPFPTPNFQLCGFSTVYLKPGEQQTITIPLPEERLEVFDQDGNAKKVAGSISFFIGGQQPDSRSKELTQQSTLHKELTYVPR